MSGRLLAVISAARGRLGLLMILAVFLVPLGVSWLGGLTQVVTCSGLDRSRISVVAQQGQSPVVLGSTGVTRQNGPVCDRLLLTSETSVARDDTLRLRLQLENRSPREWRGTVRVRVGDEPPIDIEIGSIRPGASAFRVVPFDPPEGQSEIPLEVLVGP